MYPSYRKITLSLMCYWQDIVLCEVTIVSNICLIMSMLLQFGTALVTEISDFNVNGIAVLRYRDFCTMLFNVRHVLFKRYSRFLFMGLL